MTDDKAFSLMLLQLLLEENDIKIHHNETMRDLEADEAYKLGGEYTVYNVLGNELYRGTDFFEALKVLKDE